MKLLTTLVLTLLCIPVYAQDSCKTSSVKSTFVEIKQSTITIGSPTECPKNKKIKKKNPLKVPSKNHRVYQSNFIHVIDLTALHE